MLGVSNCKHLTRFWMFLKRRVGLLICNASISFQKPAQNLKSGVDPRGGAQVRHLFPTDGNTECMRV